MGEQVVEMVRGRQALKLNVTKTAAPTPIYEDRVGVLQPVEVGSETRTVEIEIDGWLLGPLHVADYDVRETLERLTPTGARPPGWGTVSLYGWGLRLGAWARVGGDDERTRTVNLARVAASEMWEHVLRHVIAEVGESEAAVIERLRRPAGDGKSLGEVMAEIGAAAVRYTQAAAAHKAARRAVDDAQETMGEAWDALRPAHKAAAVALAVPDVG